jgi:hypothetical protein
MTEVSEGLVNHALWWIDTMAYCTNCDCEVAMRVPSQGGRFSDLGLPRVLILYCLAYGWGYVREGKFGALRCWQCFPREKK